MMELSLVPTRPTAESVAKDIAELEAKGDDLTDDEQRYLADLYRLQEAFQSGDIGPLSWFDNPPETLEDFMRG